MHRLQPQWWRFDRKIAVPGYMRRILTEGYMVPRASNWKQVDPTSLLRVLVFQPPLRGAPTGAGRVGIWGVSGVWEVHEGRVAEHAALLSAAVVDISPLKERTDGDRGQPDVKHAAENESAKEALRMYVDCCLLDQV